METKKSNCTNERAYVKPSIEVIEMELEGNILQSSSFSGSAEDFFGGGGGDFL